MSQNARTKEEIQKELDAKRAEINAAKERRKAAQGKIDALKEEAKQAGIDLSDKKVRYTRVQSVVDAIKAMTVPQTVEEIAKVANGFVVGHGGKDKANESIGLTDEIVRALVFWGALTVSDGKVTKVNPDAKATRKTA